MCVCADRLDGPQPQARSSKLSDLKYRHFLGARVPVPRPARCAAGAVLRRRGAPPSTPPSRAATPGGPLGLGAAGLRWRRPERRRTAPARPSVPRTGGSLFCWPGPAAVRPSVRAIYEQFTVGDNSGPLCYRLYRADGPAGMSESRSAAARSRGVRARHWHHVVSDGKTRTGPARSGVYEGSVASWSGPGPGPGPGGLMIIMGRLSRGGGFRAEQDSESTARHGLRR
jgi:hypothetical protein